MDAEVTNFLND